MVKMKVCPSCKSSRIRNDYKPAPIYLRVIGIRSLLCDHCNFQFMAFSPLSPKRGKSKKRKAGLPNPDQNSVKIIDLKRLSQQNNQDKIERNSTNGSITTRPPSVVGELVDEFTKKFSTEVMRLIEENFGKSNNRELTEKEKEEQDKLPICPECWSKRVKQIHRNSLEKVFLSITDHKSFYCRSCGYSFYARLGNGEDSSRSEKAL
jgi:transposase-like protein